MNCHRYSAKFVTNLSRLPNNGLETALGICEYVFYQVLRLQNNVLKSADPECGSKEACTKPVFVTLKEGAIQPETVELPFASMVSFRFCYCN